MGRQRNMSHGKEQSKTPANEFTKMETSSTPDAEFKITGYKDAQGT